jgi:cytidine deaminase
MRDIEITTTYSEYYDGDTLAVDDKKLIEHARIAAQRSWSPYSHFAVGAAVLLENDMVIEGNNQENAAFPSGLCAERVALFFAHAQYPGVPARAIAVAVFANGNWLSQPVPPCGSCLQVMQETQTRFSKPLRVILSGSKKTWIIADGRALLPLSFDGTFLETDSMK